MELRKVGVIMSDTSKIANEITGVRRALAVRTAGRTVAALISVGACAGAAEARGANHQGLTERLAAARTKAEAASTIPGNPWKFAQADPRGSGQSKGGFQNWDNWKNQK